MCPWVNLSIGDVLPGDAFYLCGNHDNSYYLCDTAHFSIICVYDKVVMVISPPQPKTHSRCVLAQWCRNMDRHKLVQNQRSEYCAIHCQFVQSFYLTHSCEEGKECVGSAVVCMCQMCAALSPVGDIGEVGLLLARR